jgi:toluene monooxygenase system protein D
MRIDTREGVGPVLQKGRTSDVIIAAIEQLNTSVTVLDRGAYVRVLVPRICRLTRAAVEALTGEPFRLPADLERVMPSFKGRLQASEEEVSWRFDRAVIR